MSEKYILQDGELKETHEWIKQYRINHKKSPSFHSHDIGSHMEFKKNKTMELIGLSKEEMDSLLQSYAERLRFDYVAR